MEKYNCSGAHETLKQKGKNTQTTILPQEQKKILSVCCLFPGGLVSAILCDDLLSPTTQVSKMPCMFVILVLVNRSSKCQIVQLQGDKQLAHIFGHTDHVDNVFVSKEIEIVSKDVNVSLKWHVVGHMQQKLTIKPDPTQRVEASRILEPSNPADSHIPAWI